MTLRSSASTRTPAPSGRWWAGATSRRTSTTSSPQGRRQPGSSFKAFVYTAAIDSEGWSPYQSIDASSRSYQVGDDWYTAHNDDDAHYGYIFDAARLRQLDQYGRGEHDRERSAPQTVRDYAQRFGIKSHLYAYPTLALGTSEVTPLEMASAYGVFAANGIRNEPYHGAEDHGPDPVRHRRQ